VRLETKLAGGIGLFDAQEDLLTAGRYRDRAEKIDRIIVHHSGAPEPPSRSVRGLAGMQASARYVVQHRQWPGFAYHAWIPYHPTPLAGFELAVFRGNDDDIRSHHTSGSNDRGWAICLQGNLYHAGMSHAQEECLEALLPWLAERLQLDLGEAQSHRY